MPKQRTQFVFCTGEADEFAKDAGVTCSVYISTKDFFDSHGYMQSQYEDHEYDELNAVMEKYDLEESTESTYDCIHFSQETIAEKLVSEPNFAFSQKFHNFLNR